MSYDPNNPKAYQKYVETLLKFDPEAAPLDAALPQMCLMITIEAHKSLDRELASFQDGLKQLVQVREVTDPRIFIAGLAVIAEHHGVIISAECLLRSLLANKLIPETPSTMKILENIQGLERIVSGITDVVRYQVTNFVAETLTYQYALEKSLRAAIKLLDNPVSRSAEIALFVKKGGDWQRKIDNARPGDRMRLDELPGHESENEKEGT